jgi:hypothetical protein
MNGPILFLLIVLAITLTTIINAQVSCDNKYMNEEILITAGKSLQFMCPTNGDTRYRLTMNAKILQQDHSLRFTMYGADNRILLGGDIKDTLKMKKTFYIPDDYISFTFTNTLEQDTTMVLTFSYDRRMSETTFLILLVNIFPIVIALVIVLAIILCISGVIMICIHNRRKLKLQKQKEEQIEFKILPRCGSDRIYLKQIVTENYLSDLPVEPCLNIFEYIEIKVKPYHSPLNVFSRKKELETVIMKQVYGVFIRNGFRSLYQLCPFVDFSAINNDLSHVPHCTRLTDVVGLNVNFWNTESWDTLKYNRHLTSIHGLEKAKIADIDQFLTCAQNIIDLEINIPDERILEGLPNLRRLKFHKLIPEGEGMKRITSLTKLESLSTCRLNLEQAQQILLMSNLTELNILELSNCSIEPMDWCNLQGLKHLTIYKSENSTVYVPLYLKSLRSLSLGSGVQLSPKSFDSNETYSNLRELSLVETIPMEFFETDNIFRFLQLEKLSITINDQTVPIIGCLEILENLRLIQLRTENKEFRKSVERIFDTIVHHLKYLDSVLLFDYLLFSKEYSLDGEFEWNKTSIQRRMSVVAK